MNKEEIKEIKEQLYYLDSELYSYQDIDNLKEYAKNLEKENQQLKKQKDDVVEYIKENKNKTIAPYGDNEDTDYEVCLFEEDINEILRMLGEIE